jgi:A/G-specific adenine glycosylase
MQADQFQSALLAWFDRHGRKHLPWQRGRDPYRVWISEILLQQTQVATVIPYFERFVQRFPDVASLAAGTADEIAALWAGLGYYARARNLHQAALCVMERHGGRFPADLEALMALPGVGRSTAGAILSLGFGLRAAILDGNVKRVLCRYAGLEGWPGETGVNRELWRLSEALTPAARVADYNQAMMDLGATACARRAPACGGCPLRAGCRASLLGLTDAIPAPRPKREQPLRHCFMLVLRNGEGEVYLERRPPTGIWGGLRSLLEFDSLQALADWCAARGIDSSGLERLPLRRHTFTHYRLDFVPVIIRTEGFAPSVSEESGQGWFNPEQAGGLPAPVARLLREVGAFPERPGQLSIGL